MVKCNVCGSISLKSALALPSYPTNGVFLNSLSEDKKYSGDFILYACQACSHLQAESAFAADQIYTDEYVYVANLPGVKARQNFFTTRTLRYAEGKTFNRVIDVGCNDLALLRKLKSRGVKAKHWIGVDPIDIKERNNSDDIEFISGYIQEVDLPYRNDAVPDLIVSDQTFEHIPAVNEILKELIGRVAPNSSFVVCVPSLELLINSYSFHYLIHEHLNYFTEKSLRRLFHGCNLNLLYSELENNVGGNLLQIFSSTTHGAGNATVSEYGDVLSRFNDGLSVYKQNLAVTTGVLGNTRGRIYAFGASNVTGTFAYFLGSNLSEATCIFDETPHKENKYMPYIAPQIVMPEEGMDLSDCSVLVTAHHASRAIIGRLASFKPNRIINPLNAF